MTDEQIIKQAEKIGWANYFDVGFGPQPVARFDGDQLGPIPTAIAMAPRQRRYANT